MLSNKDILKDSNALLREKSELVKFPLSKEDKQLIHDMMEYVKNSVDEELCEKYDLSPAVGLAAPQVGVLKQICTIFIKGYEDPEEDYYEEDFELTLINPKIMAHSTSVTNIEDGEQCLSVPDKHDGLTPRYEYIKVRYFDLKGKMKTIELEDFEAIVAQHEMDHLRGVLYYDYFDKPELLIP